MMKKVKRLRLASALMALLLTVLYAVPVFSAAVPGEEPIEPQTLDPGFMQPLTSYETEHSYDEGIVDGAVYYLRNAYNGQYMDVNNAVDANNTGISTYTFHGGPNQQFRIHYIGQGLYEIVPAYSQRRLHMASNHDLVIYDKNWSGEQKFKIAMLNSNTGMIFPQYGNFTRALAWDETRPNMVASKPLSAMSSHSHAYWIFERVGTTADMYAKFYLRYNGQHQQRIDVIEGYTAEGSLVHACPVPYGNVNQEWKTYYDENDGCYYLRPGNSFDMALDYRGTNLAIYRGTNPATQGFQIIQSSTLDEATGKPLYALKTSQNTYVTMGIGMGGGVNEPYSYIGTTTTPTFCWFLEGVPHDATKPDTLTSINTWLSSNVEPGYMQEQYFYFTPTETKHYKVELRNGNVDFGTIVSETGVNAEIFTRKTANGTRIANAYFQAGVTYRITVYSKNAVDGSTTAFSIRVRHLVAVGHGNWRRGDSFAAVDAISDFRQTLRNVGFYAMNLTDILTAEEALEGRVPDIDYSYFDSDVFLYVGHGSPGYAWYKGENESQYLNSVDLPNMSNCEIAVWANCYSANDPTGGNSLADQSYVNGAETVIGWEIKVYQLLIEPYVTTLFQNLAMGKTVDEASDIAIDAVSDVEGFNVFQIAAFILALKIYGNKNNTIVYAPNTATASINANAGLTTVDSSIDTSKYSLIAENESEGIKVYARMINGIVVDDYYIEFYNDGVLTNVSKSAYTITDADVMVVESQIEQMENSQAMMQNSAQSVQSEYLIRCIDGVWRLVECRSMTADGCDCCTQYAYYDALTGEEVA